MSAYLRMRIQQAYEIIGHRTPLPVDCGQLCGGACCKGENDKGMLLFPGEADLYRDHPAFHIRRVAYMGEKAWHLSCNGSCDRSLRPLSCRIFPLAPYVNRRGNVLALPDPRAFSICPLSGGEYLAKRFQRGTQRALSYLAQEPRQRHFMDLVSRELEELRKFWR